MPLDWFCAVTSIPIFRSRRLLFGTFSCLLHVFLLPVFSPIPISLEGATKQSPRVYLCTPLTDFGCEFYPDCILFFLNCRTKVAPLQPRPCSCNARTSTALTASHWELPRLPTALAEFKSSDASCRHHQQPMAHATACLPAYLPTKRPLPLERFMWEPAEVKRADVPRACLV